MAGSFFSVDVVTPEAVVWQGQADFVLTRTTEGEMGVLADHEPTMAALATGAVSIRGEEESISVGVHGGFLQVYRNQVTLLTDRAEISKEGHADAQRLASMLRESEEDASEEDESEEDESES